MQEQPRRAVPSPITNPAPPSIASGNHSETDTANAKTPGSGTGNSQLSSPQSPMSPVQEEIQRVRKQIEDMAEQLKDAFKKEEYSSVRELGERKQDLEAKLKTFEERYSNDKHELQGVKVQIEEVEADLKVAFENENYPKVQELGARKDTLKKKLQGLESSFGLHNAVYQVGDRVSVVGLKSPRGGNYNGVVGTITEYIESKQRYKVSILDDAGQRQEDKLIAVSGSNLKAHDEEAQKGQSKTRQLSGEIKLWFPRKHFGFITPDNKPEGDPDVFFHSSHVKGNDESDSIIRRFARVALSIIPAPKGPQARDVSITDYQPEKEAEAEREAALAANGSGTPGDHGPGAIPDASSAPATNGKGSFSKRPAGGSRSNGSNGISYATPDRDNFSLAPRQNGGDTQRQGLLQPTPDGDPQKKRRGKRKRGCRAGRKVRRQRERAAELKAKQGSPPAKQTKGREKKPALMPAKPVPSKPIKTPSREADTKRVHAQAPTPFKLTHSPRRSRGETRRPASARRPVRMALPRRETGSRPFFPHGPSNLGPTPTPQRQPQCQPQPHGLPMNPNAGAFSPGGLDGASQWRRGKQGGGMRPSPRKSKGPPPGFGNKPPGLSNISINHDMPAVSGNMMSSSPGNGIPPISGAMQSIDSDDDYGGNRNPQLAPHPAPQRGGGQPRQPSYGSSVANGPPRHPQQPALSLPRAGSSRSYNGHDGYLNRQPSCATEDLPSFQMNTLERWESIMSNESMQFGDNPLSSPVSARQDPGNSWRPSQQDSPRDRAIRRAEHGMNAFRSRGQG